MATEALVKDLKEIELPLESIYLDPNNPRFVGKNWTYVPDDEIENPNIQDQSRLRLVNEFGVDKLRMNMEVNGYLPIDRVIVREFTSSKYVVLEGNRRICAAKLMSDYSPDGSAISKEVLDSLKQIPCLQYIGTDKDASWVFQGLRHISSISDWSSFNKAKLLVEQMERDDLNLTDVAKRFGLTPHGAGQWVRGYYAFKQALESSDFINEVDERAYPYLQELFSRSSAAAREWMEWNDKEHQFDNALNFNEFVSWLYPRFQTEQSEENQEPSEVMGDWEQRILRRGNDIRQLAFLLREDKEIFEKFRRDLDVEKAYSEAMTRKYQREAKETYDPSTKVFRVIASCVSVLENIPYKMLKDSDSRELLFQALQQLQDTIVDLKA